MEIFCFLQMDFKKACFFRMGHGDLTTLSDLRALKRNLVSVGAPCSRVWAGGAGTATSSVRYAKREK